MGSVNSEIFARILFSRIALKHIKKSQLEHDLPTSVNGRVILSLREGFIFAKISEFTVFSECLGKSHEFNHQKLDIHDVCTR